MTTETLKTESYVTTTGRQYTLVNERMDRRKMINDPPLWEEYWTHRDERGWGPSLGYASNRHQTREAAIAALEERLREQEAEGEWAPVSRIEYENACTAFAVESMEDDAIATSYGVRHGDFSMSHYTSDDRIAMALARRRQMALDEEERVHRASEPAPVVEVATCQRCGNEVPRTLLMTASVGGALCPDCWHEVNDGDGFGL